jgi:hypothetical protein
VNAFIYKEDINIFRKDRKIPNEKLAVYITLILNLPKDFQRSEWRKFADDMQLLLKFDNYQHRHNAINMFHRKCASNNMRLRPKYYYRVGSTRYSSREFIIKDIPEEIADLDIKRAISKVLGAKSFYLKPRIKASPYTAFTLANEKSCHLIKQHWSIAINNNMYRIAPAYMDKHALRKCNDNLAGFTGFKDEDTTVTVIEFLTSLNPKYAFKHCTENLFYVSFETETALFNACNKTIYIND